MENQTKAQQNRLELYLKNMDLLKISPSVSVAVYDSGDLCKDEVQAILNFLKNWSVCECYFFGEKETVKSFTDFFHGYKNSTFKNIRFYLESNIPDEQLVCEMRDTLPQILQQKLFITDQYTKQYKIWGQEVIRFYGDKPERYEINAGKRAATITIKFPEDVIGMIKQSSGKPDEIIPVGDTDGFDRTTGKLRIQGPREEAATLLILRSGSVFQNDSVAMGLNFSNPDILTRIKEIDNQFFIKHPEISFKNFYAVEKFLPDANFCQTVNLIYDKKNAITDGENKTIIRALAPEKLSGDRMTESDFILKQIYIEQFRKDILNRLKLKKNELKYYLKIDHPWYPDLVNLTPIIPQIDTHKYIQGTPYALNTEINIKLLSNSCKKSEVNQTSVQINHLLCINKSFSEMKFDVDALFLAGANHVLFNFKPNLFDSGKNPLENLETWDPNYSAYFDWFAYIHQLGHFFKLGIRRPELLVLYPSYNDTFETFRECITEIGRTGLDYTLVDFGTFENNALSSIQDREIIVHNHAYRIVIVPAVDTVSIETIQKLNRFFAKGGIIIAIGRLPGRTLDNRKNALLNRINKQIWLDGTEGASTMFKQHESGGLGYFQADTDKLSNIFMDISKNLRVSFDGKTAGIKYQIREIKDAYLIFFLNTNQTGIAEFNFVTKYFGRPYLWNFAVGESELYPFWHVSNHKLHLRLRLRPRESQFFIIDRKQSLKLCQLYASELDYAQIIKQDEHALHIDGWQRQEGHYQVKIKNAVSTSTLSYSVDKKLPILVIDTNGWYLDSGHFKGQVSLGDQSYPFPYLSASITYHKVIILKEDYLKKKKLMLELGKVRDWCKIYINDRFVKQSLFEPWVADITNYVKTGENKISIEVINRLSNRISEQKSDLDDLITVHEYGLFGPVKIIPYSAFSLKI